MTAATGHERPRAAGAGRRRTGLLAGLAGLAAAAGVWMALSRPDEPPRKAATETVAAPPEAPAPPELAAEHAPAPLPARGEPFVVAAPDRDEPEAPAVPPLAPGTTTADLLGRYVDDVCACADRACVTEARNRHSRQFGQAIRSPRRPDSRALLRKLTECIQRIDGTTDG